MSWTKDIENESGVVVGYWEIEKWNLNNDDSTIEISYRGYVSQIAKDAGKRPVIYQSIIAPADDLQSLLDPLLAAAETLVITAQNIEDP